VVQSRTVGLPRCLHTIWSKRDEYATIRWQGRDGAKGFTQSLSRIRLDELISAKSLVDRPH
jgi:hypothetical protein